MEYNLMIELNGKV